MLQIYNSLTRKKEPFIPIEKNSAKVYTCGPTVYNYLHIGNWRTLICSDIITRILRYFNYNVRDVINITDVDDKTIRNSGASKSNNPKETLKKFTEKYTTIFINEMNELRINQPQFLVKATDHIREMETIINLLYEKGYAYIAKDGIYFDVSKDKAYGQLVKISHNPKRKSRILNDEYDKEEVSDFALWKFKKNDEPSWTIIVDSKEFEGRPGWHIECSAMSTKYLGQPFDIHMGGIDLKFPHHENEIAQSECATGKKFVNYWIHFAHLVVNGKKMAKSLGNFYTLRDIKNKGFTPLALRYLLVTAHYRQQLNFTFEALENAQKTVKKLNDFYQLIKKLDVPDGDLKIKHEYFMYKDEFENALKDDFNVPRALAAYFEFENFINRNLNLLTTKDLKYINKFLDDFNKIFALFEDFTIPPHIIELAEKRMEFKRKKEFEEADKIREKIAEEGYEVKDYNFINNGYLILKQKY